jgi:hypothetical protein
MIVVSLTIAVILEAYGLVFNKGLKLENHR